MDLAARAIGCRRNDGASVRVKAIVLAPGPSLTLYEPQCSDLLIGVNRASTKIECDAWCCGDTPLVEQIADQVIGNPLLITYGVTMDTLRDHKFTWRGEIVSWSPIAESQWLHTSLVNWPWCSFTAAIVYAAFRGASEIDCYGCDWRGQLDFDDVAAGKNRSEDRWREERNIFTALSAILAMRGCAVTRKVPDVVS